MTETAESFQAPPIEDRITTAIEQLDNLSVVAQHCHLNFDWLANTPDASLRVVPLLDFDIIFGTMGNLLVRQIVDSARKNTTWSVLPETLVGPSAMRLLLDNLPEFCLPPGTTEEMLIQGRKLNRNVGERAGELIRKLQEARTSDDPAQVILNQRHSEGLLAAVRQEIDSFAGDLDDARLLDSLLSRSTPIEELTDGRAKDDMKAYQAAYKQLGQRRRNTPLNNHCDAVNFSMAVRMFRHPSVRSKSRPVPVMISYSKQVTSLQEIQTQVDLPDPTSYRLLNDQLYLVVSLGLIRNFEDNYDLAANAAQILHRDIERLREAHFALRNQIRRAPGTEGPEWGMLRLRFSEFHNAWSSIFAPALRALEHDRAALINRLLPPRVAHLLTSKNQDNVAAAFGALILTLRAHAKRGHEMDSLSMERFTDPRLGDAGSIFEFSFPLDPGALLSETPPGTPLDAEDRDGEGGLCRVVAHLRHLQSGGALFAFDPWSDLEGDGGRLLTSTWLHALDSETVFQRCLALIKGLASHAKAPPECDYAFFGPAKKIEGRGDFANTDRAFKDALAGLEGFDYFKIICGPYAAAADLRPLDGVEMQVSVAAAVDALDDQFERSVADAVRGTNRFLIDTKTVLSVLKFITSKLKNGDFHGRKGKARAGV